jgi:peptide deformylase
MAKLKILRYPDQRLHRVALPVTAVDDGVRKLVDDLFETMYDSDGIGLAATQVDVHRRIIVIDVAEPGDPEHGVAPKPDPIVLINPELVKKSDELAIAEEGCLSVPTVYDKVQRHARITVRALNREGNLFEREADGLLAVCIQHEMDHLIGKVFVEYLSPLKRERIRTKMLKKTREEG